MTDQCQRLSQKCLADLALKMIMTPCLRLLFSWGVSFSSFFILLPSSFFYFCFPPTNLSSFLLFLLSKMSFEHLDQQMVASVQVTDKQHLVPSFTRFNRVSQCHLSSMWKGTCRGYPWQSTFAYMLKMHMDKGHGVDCATNRYEI